MPIYEYHCNECNNEFEKLMGFSDPQSNAPECPVCNSTNTRKRLSTIAAFNNNGAGYSSAPTCGSTSGFG